MTKYLPYTLTLEAPLVLPKLGGDPNTAETLDYLPGSAIRGAFAAALRPAPGERADSEFVRLILGGDVCWLSAYPRIGTQRSLPIPASWRMRKAAEGRDENVVDALAVVNESADLRPVTGGNYATIGDASPSRVAPRTRTKLHFQMDRDRQRATQAKGAVFNYGALEPGQCFAGIVTINGRDDNEVDTTASRIRSLALDRLWLGRSRIAGYGGACRLDWGVIRSREADGAMLANGQLEGDFRVLFTSDCLMRDPRTGAWDPNVVESELTSALRVATTSRALVPRTVGGFNRTWRMELPQAMGLGAGSVFAFHADSPIPEAIWLSLERNGLGERRAEGYGRFITLRGGPLAELQVPATSKPKPAKPALPAPALVRSAELRIALARLLRQARQLAAEHAGAARDRPTPHLLARLRLPLGRAAEPLRDFDQLLAKAKRTAQDQLQRCRVGKRTLRELLDEPPLLPPPAPAITGVDWPTSDGARFESAARCEYLATLLQEISRAVRKEYQ